MNENFPAIVSADVSFNAAQCFATLSADLKKFEVQLK